MTIIGREGIGLMDDCDTCPNCGEHDENNNIKADYLIDIKPVSGEGLDTVVAFFWACANCSGAA